MNAAAVSWRPNPEGDIPEGYYVQVTGPQSFITTVAVTAPALRVDVTGLRNGVTYSARVIAATRDGSATPTAPVTVTPTTGMEGVVAGLIVEFEPGNEQPLGTTDVPGKERVGVVDLAVSQQVTDDAVLVELSEPVDEGTARQIADDLAADAAVAWAEPDQFFFTSSDSLAQPVSTPTDANYATDQWNLWDSYGIGIGEGNVTMTDAWADSRGDGVTVAVIDTGITGHPDLDSRVVAGYDFVSSPDKLSASRQPNAPPVAFDGDYVNEGAFGAIGRDSNPADPGDWRGVAPVRDSTWHGTKIAGLIAAEANSDGITGVAPGARIQPVRALSWRGGLLSDIAASITWASGGAVDGAPTNATPSKVINMSFSVETTCPTTLQDAIDGALERGSILIAAAGNAGDDAAKYAPGNCNGVITVGATNREGNRASYSNHGSTIDLSAPGGDAGTPVTVTSNSGQTSPAAAGVANDYGTSVAAAHVSGAAAILASREPRLSPSGAYRSLTGSEFTKAFANPTCDPAQPDYACGTGILSLSEALAQTAAYSNSTDKSINTGYTSSTGRFASASSSAFATAGAWTVEAWVRLTAAVCTANLWAFVNNPNKSAGSAGYAAVASGGVWKIQKGTTLLDTGAPVACGSWQHISLVWDGSTTMTFYVNGQSAYSTSTTAPALGNVLALGTYLDPASVYGGWNFWDGDIDEFRFYSTDLTQSQIVTDMHTHGMNSSVSSANYVAYYDFNYTETTPATIENQVAGAASSTDLTTSGSPTLSDVASSATSGTTTTTTTWTFDRSYLTAAGGWSVPAAAVTSSALVVGGGGGGGRQTGGGGGGGGVMTYSTGNTQITAGTTVAVQVGMGGLGGSANVPVASSGQASKLAAVTGGGGGYGGARDTAGGNAPDVTGDLARKGSGGGAGTSYEAPVDAPLKGGVGFGNGGDSPGTLYRAAAGGGGNGLVNGGDAIGGSQGGAGGAGGAGRSSSLSGTSLIYGSGGGGAGTATGGAGGDGAGTGASAGAGTSGTANRGGGGGGSLGTFTAGSGGSGVVIVSYTTYTLSYNANGGSGTPPSSEALTTSATTSVAIGTGLTRTGYTFSGWNTAANGSGTPYAAGATFTMGSANVTLYAQWTINTYTLAYNANGGSGTAPSPVNITYGNSTTIAAGTTLTKTGYTFSGWNTAANGSGTPYAAGATFTMGSANVTLYAQWAINTYTLTYNANGGSGTAPSPVNITYGNSTTIAAGTTLTKTGYTFSSWKTAPSSGIAYAAGATFTMGSANVTLYAQWTANTYTVTFNSQGGSSITSSSYTTGGSIADPGNPTRTGYTFNGWFTASSGGSALTFPYSPGTTSNLILYAQWTIVYYSYSFDPNGPGNTPDGGTLYFGQAIPATCYGTTRGGYTLTGWQSSFDSVTYGSACSTPGFFALTGFTMPASNVVFTAQWTANTYTVSFDSKGGTSVADGTYATGGTLAEPTAPTKPGYTFAGWSLTDGGTPVTWTTGTYTPTGYGDFTMYAVWTANTYTVTFDSKGGTSVADGTYATGGTLAEPTAPTKPGYTFAGWSLTDGGSPVTWTTGTYSPAGYGPFTMYAVWTAFDVVYDDNGGIGGPGTLSEAPGATVTVLSTTPTKAGYTFDSWLSSLGGTVVAGDTFTMPSANVTLTAQWTPLPTPSPGSASVSTPTSDSVTIRPLNSAYGWEAFGTGFRVVVRPEDSTSRPMELADDDQMVVPVGGALEVSGVGYDPDSVVTITFTPNDGAASALTTQTTTTSSGAFTAQVAVTAAQSSGAHELIVEGATVGPVERTFRFDVMVVKFPTLSEPTTLRAAAFFKGGKGTFSRPGRQRLDNLIGQVPPGARDVRVYVVGMSTPKATVDENLELARDRAKKVAAYLAKKGVAGVYTVSVATTFIVDGSPRTILVGADGSTKTAGDEVDRERLTPVVTATGKPLTTASITFSQL